MPQDRTGERPSERPSERRSAARTSVVWDALRPALDDLAAERPDGTLDVLDIGGGTGGFAVRVAELGHRVTVVDPSPDALASLDRRARELAVTVAGLQGDLSHLLDVVGPASADAVLCHGVLEVVEQPGAGLATLRSVLRSGGALSLLVAQRHAAVVARAMAGHFAQALSLLRGSDQRAGGPADQAGDQHPGHPRHRFTDTELRDLLDAAGFEVVGVHAVRVFADLVPGSLLDLEPGATAALVDLERAVAERPEYRPLAAQLHVLAR